MRCQACGQENRAGFRFCTECGAALPRTEQDEAGGAARFAPSAGRPRAEPPAPPSAYQPAPPSAYQAAYVGDSYATPGAVSYPAGFVSANPAPYQAGYAAAGPLPHQAGYANAGPGSAPYQAGYADPAASLPYGYIPVPQVINNITVAAPAAPPPVVVLSQQGSNDPPLLLRALYFLFVGLWLGGIWTVLSWLFILSIIGLPLGLWMVNRLPLIMTLKMPRTETQVSVQHGVVVIAQAPVPQRPLAARALYFLLVGWWASGLWLLLAWALIAATLGLGLPLSFWMFNRAPAVTTLAR